MNLNNYVRALLLAVLTGGVTQAQDQHPVSNRKFADVMGFGGAPWLERSERDAEEAPEMALDAIGIKPGMIIADVGSGTGYFSRRMAKRTGAAGKVYAVDIQPRMIQSLQEYSKREGITNIEGIVSTANDPKLPAASIDMILMVDVYHEFSKPQEMLRKMRAALKPGGRMILLEYRKEDPKVPIRLEHKMTVGEAKAEIEAEGFRLDKVISSLPRQHILIFVPTANQ
ncbi:MAG: methyltransferase domain-containing protein [Candidatus Solibacter usitatus]|nr:methyltransferase domain-containing protein [Candidatus Solibacter usitatus]